MKAALHTLLWVIEFALGLAFIIAVLLFIMPWLLSMDGTRSAILHLLKGPLKGELVVQKAHLSWWNETDLKAIRYEANDGKISVSCKELSTPSSLWRIFFGQHDLGELKIDSPIATIHLEPEEAVNTPVVNPASAGPSWDVLALPLLANLDLHKVWANLTPHLKGVVNLFDGQIIFEGKTIENVRLEDLGFEANLAQGSDTIQFKLDGVTRQKELTGSLNWSGSFGPFNSADPTLSIKGNLKKLPVLGIDQIITLFYPRLHNAALTTIGPDIDLDMQFDLSNQRLDLAFVASSMLFNANVGLLTQNDMVSLTAPARFGLTLTPYLAEAFFSLGPYMRGLSLANSPRISLDVSDLEIPLTEKGMDWNHLKIRALMNLLDMKFATPVLFKGIELERLKATLTTDNLDEDLFFDTTMTLSLDEKKALIAASGSLSHALEINSSLTLALSTQSFPVAILDKVFKGEGFLLDALGETCDFTCAIDRDMHGRTGTLYFASPTVSFRDANFQLKDEGSTLIRPVHLLFSPSRQFWEKHAGGIGSGKIDIEVEKLELNRFDFSKLNVIAKATSPEGFYGNFSLPNPIFSFTIQTFSSIALDLQSEGLKAATTLNYDHKNKTLSFVSPIAVSFSLEPNQAASLWKEFAPPPIFLAPFIANGSIKPFSTPLGQNFLNSVIIEGTLDVPCLSIQAPNKTTAVIRDATSSLILNTKIGQFIGKLDAQLGSQESALVPLHSECIVRKLYFQPKINMSEAEYLLKVGFTHLDTRFIDAWGSRKTRLSPLLGNWISVKGELLKGSTSGALALDAECEKGSFHLNVARQDDQLTLSKGQPMRANLTFDRQGFRVIEDYLGQTLPVDLASPSTLDIQVSNLLLPMQKDGWKVDLQALSQATIDGLLQTESLSFVESATKKPVTLNHLAFRFGRPNASSPLLLNLKATVDAAKPGQVDVKVRLQDIQYTNNQWDVSKANAQIDANFQQLPASVADLLTTSLGLKSQTLSVLFGEQISGSASAKLQDCSGPVSLVVNSPLSRISLDGTLQSGVLVLNQPFIAQVTMTEELSRRFLQGINPLSIAAIQSDGPMTLTVQNEKFSLPIFPWDLRSAHIGQARLELGRIVCRNQGNIHTALDLLKLGQFSRSNTLNLWFAPMDFSLDQGILECERTEFLVANSVDLATWGEIDLVRNRVDAVLGLTAQALSTAFGIKGLPDTYVLQIPMKGPLDNVKIDTGKATAKIALLLAWQKASAGAGSMIGGTQGAIVGGLLGQLAKLPDSNAKTPPAKHPFPWEKQPPSPSTIPPKKKKSAIKPGDKPLKQLIKLLK